MTVGQWQMPQKVFHSFARQTKANIFALMLAMRVERVCFANEVRPITCSQNTAICTLQPEGLSGVSSDCRVCVANCPVIIWKPLCGTSPLTSSTHTQSWKFVVVLFDQSVRNTLVSYELGSFTVSHRVTTTRQFKNGTAQGLQGQRPWQMGWSW